MCACEPGFVCKARRGTRLDDRYPDLPDERDEDAERLRLTLLAEDYGSDRGE